jgi:uncharacterized protein YecT (DUF1311 family)
MKNIAAAALLLVCFTGPRPTSAQSSDPCRDKNSNVEMRDCYSKEQARVNADVDLLASNITAHFRKLAQDPGLGPDVADLLRKAASAVTRSQETWKAYRDQHCRAVAYSWTNGSGSGTAYESCLLRLAQTRFEELHSAFNLPQSP